MRMLTCDTPKNSRFLIKNNSIQAPRSRAGKEKENSKKREHKRVLVLVPESPLPHKKSNIRKVANQQQGTDSCKQPKRKQNTSDELRRLPSIYHKLSVWTFEHVPLQVAVHCFRGKNFNTMVYQKQANNDPDDTNAVV